MRSRQIIVLAGLLLAAQFAFADSSYQTTVQITGGQLVDALKSTPFIGRRMSAAFAPTSQMIMVRGNRKATVGKDATDIVDLDKGEMIHIDNVQKTYTIVTFEQMRQAATAMMQQLSTMPAAQAQPQPQAQMPPDVQIKFDTNVNNTGVSKMVNGVMAQEQIITLKMTMTVPPNAQNSADNSADHSAAQAAGQANGQPGAPGAQPNSGTFTVTADCWIAPEQPESREIRDFDRRVAEKMMEGVDVKQLMEQMKISVNNTNTALSQMFGGHPGSAEAMKQMEKEIAKIQGTRIMEVVSMGGDVPADAHSQTTRQAQQTQQINDPVTTGQIATDAATNTAATESSRMGGVGSTLSGSIIGGWRRRKQQQAQQAQQTQASQAVSTPGTTPGMQHVTLIEMTNSMSDFSHEPIPASAFEIPAGFTQVPSPMVQ